MYYFLRQKNKNQNRFYNIRFGSFFEGSDPEPVLSQRSDLDQLHTGPATLVTDRLWGIRYITAQH